MKLSKTDIAHIKDIANRLPECYTAENQKTIKVLYGYQLISQGITIIDKKPVESDKKYTYKTDDGVKVNHFKRIKKICESGRVKDAQVYIDEISGLGKEHYKLLLGIQKPQL